MEEYLGKTSLLNNGAPEIAEIVNRNGWMELAEQERIRQIYDFVRNNIFFGYNETDDLPAAKILSEGYGQCNTKSTLFMALLRAVGIPCRFHGFTVNKKLQKGIINGIIYRIAPTEIIHSWVEVFWNNKWINMEGIILDNQYFQNVRNMFQNCQGSFYGYGIATKNLQDPQNEWTGGDTYIQKESIVKDLGIFNSPDEFYQKHGSNLKGFKKVLYKYLIRKIMNARVEDIRRRRRGFQLSPPGVLGELRR